MALKCVARDVLPSPAMAVVDECLLLKGVKPTAAFAIDLWKNLAEAYKMDEPLWVEGDWSILYNLTTTRTEKKTWHKAFILILTHDGKRIRTRARQHVGSDQGVSRDSPPWNVPV